MNQNWWKQLDLTVNFITEVLTSVSNNVFKKHPWAKYVIDDFAKYSDQISSTLEQQGEKKENYSS